MFEGTAKRLQKLLQDQPGREWTVDEILDEFFTNHKDWCEEKMKGSTVVKTTDVLRSRIAAEIHSTYAYAIKKGNSGLRRKGVPRAYIFYWDNGQTATKEISTTSTGLAQAAELFLKDHPGQWHSSGEVAEWIIDNCEDIANSMRTQPKHSSRSKLRAKLSPQIKGKYRKLVKQKYVICKEGHPPRFQWRSGSGDVGTQEFMQPAGDSQKSESETSQPAENEARLEQHLYRPLREFLRAMNICSHRIVESRSSSTVRRGGNRWLHPDIVGMELLTGENWNRDVQELMKANADNRAKFWSFEVKSELTRSNVRERFFQAVSNSSWANYGYLVAKKINGENTWAELRMLSSLHGIGVIELNAGSPGDSKLSIQARERPDVDWATCNRIAEENPDFRKFIENMLGILAKGKIGERDWGLD